MGLAQGECALLCRPPQPQEVGQSPYWSEAEVVQQAAVEADTQPTPMSPELSVPLPTPSVSSSPTQEEGEGGIRGWCVLEQEGRIGSVNSELFVPKSIFSMG